MIVLLGIVRLSNFGWLARRTGAGLNMNDTQQDVTGERLETKRDPCGLEQA